jgi:hypothetical protein
LPLVSADGSLAALTVETLFGTTGAGTLKIHVIFRTCDRVLNLHSKGRPFDLDKGSIIRACFNSLFESLEGFDHSIHVLGDRLSAEITAFFNTYPVTLTNSELGNDESIRQSLSRAYERPDDEWVYLCEDDYLHVPETFRVIRDLVDNRHSVLRTRPTTPFLGFIANHRLTPPNKAPLFIHPADYPDRYLPRKRRYSLLFLAELAHWRQISNTTFTLLAEAGTFKRFRKQFDRSASGAKDGYLSRKVFGTGSFAGRALCVSPIPGLSTHMHEGTMTPFVDWEAVYHRQVRLLADRNA